MTTESQRYNCFTRNGGNTISKQAGPDAKDNNPTTGLTLLWAPNPFRGNFNQWQVSREEVGKIFHPSSGKQTTVSTASGTSQPLSVRTCSYRGTDRYSTTNGWLNVTEQSYIRHVVIILNVCTLQSIVRCDNTATVFVHHWRILLERSENYSRFRRPRDLRCGFAASRLQRLRVRLPSVVVNVSCGCCALSGLCIGLITRPEESYRCGVCQCDREASKGDAISEYGPKCHKKENEEMDRQGSILASE
jgi:hypothetical protein